MNTILKTFLIFILLFSLAGCATIKEKVHPESRLAEEEEVYTPITLPATEKLRFHDIPVPKGFKLVSSKSFIFQTEDTRVALLKYIGRAKLHNIVEFYKEQMSFYNWSLLNVVEYGKSVLNFERRGQTCIVTIESQGLRKAITISVAPKAKGSLEKEPK